MSEQTMKIKTQDLTGPALDWAVAKCQRLKGDVMAAVTAGEFSPSTQWHWGGPIIEREHITLRCYTDALWDASIGRLDYVADGPTPLIAAMRCYVASKLGDEVDVPEGLV